MYWRDEYWWNVVYLGDAGWYWHLYRKDTRINGGISPTKNSANERARDTVLTHHLDQHIKPAPVSSARYEEAWRTKPSDSSSNGK